MPSAETGSAVSESTDAGRRHPGTRDRRRILAALDLGTNNCRLLIARPTQDGFRVVDGFSRIVRLGESVADSGELCEAAMTRTIDALAVCADKMERRRVTNARCVATEAARRAQNCETFLERVRGETGLDLEIISSREEAALTLSGCLPLLDESIPYALVFDVGGGSAELVWLRLEPGQPPSILGWVSLPCGVVTITERHGGNDFSRDAYASVIGHVEEMLLPFERRHGIRARIESGEAQVLGTAGTVTTIAGVNMGLTRYNRSMVDGSYLDFDAVRTISHNLSASTFDQRAAHPCIGPGRADLVVAGCAVLEAVCRTWPAGRLRVADRGVREGILLELIGRPEAAGVSISRDEMTAANFAAE